MKHNRVMEKDIKDLLANIPRKPGVYLMKNLKKEIIYIGKAINLAKRVRSYFSGRKDPKTEILSGKIGSIDTIVTLNEYEALLLENNLIKKWKPRYNIDLKDGKTYPVIKITDENFPRVYRTRTVKNDRGKYYGPYPHIQSIDKYLELIKKLFRIRRCGGKLKKRCNPCLYFHMQYCSAPCCGKITKEEYLENIRKTEKLLSGGTGILIKELKDRMDLHVTKLEFEMAAEYRDALEALKILDIKQKIVDFDDRERDYIACANEENNYCFSVMQMRNGKLTGKNVFYCKAYGSEEDTVTHFFLQYYKEPPPPRIYLHTMIKTDLISRYLRETFSSNTKIFFPERGKHKAIVKMAMENSKIDLLSRIKKNRKAALSELQKILKLPALPERIEGFDISHLSGKHSTASMVSFLNGEPDNQAYRRFKIKTLKGKIDDYAAIREVIARRYTRIINENRRKPDLILIDGGRGQVNSAKSVLKALGMDEIPVFGLAKRNEEIFKPGESAPVILSKNSESLKLLQKVRDESHRFASAYNRILRSREISLSTLEKIPGIGKARSKKMLTLFGSMGELSKQTTANLSKKCKISMHAAETVRIYLKKTKDN